MAEEIHWSDPLEDITKQEAERCLALAWAHGESQRWCMRWDTTLMFPSIILATFSGAGSIGADKLLPFNGAATLVGIISLVVGTLQTIQNYFAFSKNAEGHRIAALQYGKLHSQLQTQLALPRRERKRAEEIIDWLQQERDRLSEIVPLIPAPIKKMFHDKFGTIENFAMPANLNGLTPVFVTRHIAEVVVPTRVDIAHGNRR
jgi:hypothetical protein